MVVSVKYSIKDKNFVPKWDTTLTDYVAGNSSFKDRTGEKKGTLTAMYPIRKGKTTCWVCLCDCGNTTVIEVANMYKRRSCSCGISRPMNKNPRFTGVGELSGSHFNVIKQCAKIRNIQFELNKQEIYDLFLKQKNICALSGLPIQLGNLKNRTASLDRVDSKKHYYIENVQWVHKDINRIKNDFGEDRFIYLCKLVAKRYELAPYQEVTADEYHKACEMYKKVDIDFDSELDAYEQEDNTTGAQQYACVGNVCEI